MNTEWAPLYLSGKLALVSTVMLLLLAAPLAYLLAYRRFRGKVLVEALVGLPLVLPPTVLGFLLLMAFGPRSAFGRAWEQVTGGPLVFTFVGIVLASLVQSLPYAIQPLKAAFERLDRRLLESAYVLGCTPTSAFFRVVLPNTLGGVAAAAILSFAHVMGEFGVVLMVGGSIPGETRVASIAIYEQVEALNYGAAWVMSIALIAVSYVVLVAVSLLHRRGTDGLGG